jgi:hypothetical protein
VLVGGLGLGYAVTVLARRPRIRHIVVVDNSHEVIQLVQRATLKNLGRDAAKVTVVFQDLFDYLRRCRANPDHGVFTWAFYDIWTSDGEVTFFDTVLPLRNLSEGLVRHEPACWNEDVMRGQLATSLWTRAMTLDMSPPDRAVPEPAPREQNLAAYCARMPEDDQRAKWWNWRVPFFEWVRDFSPDTARMQRGAQFYASVYGCKDWLDLWTCWTLQPRL